MTSRFGPWAIAIAVALAAVFALFGSPQVEAPLGRGAVAPGFSLPRVGGDPVSLEGLRGQVVLVNFWATWCKPCEDEMPAMERLYQELAPEGFEMLAVSVDEPGAGVKAFADRLGLSFPILLDPTKRTAGEYQAFRFPETVLVDRDGTIAARYIGPREWDDPAYVERIRRLLHAPSES